MKPLNVLVGCERTGIVRDAFRALGHNAWSCDLEPSTSDEGGYHLEGDVLWWLDGRPAPCCKEGRGWDLLIVHPPCTYLCSSGLHWNHRVPGRAKKTETALRFVRKLMRAPVPHIAIENPVGCIGTRIRPADQSIQPYEFGNNASKRTCLWLEGLPPLRPTKRVKGRTVVYKGRRVERWANQTNSGQNRLGPSPERMMLRAATYPGIAKAMARQWSSYILKEQGK